VKSGIPEAAFINTPSDVMMLVILLGCSLFFLWVLFRGSHISDEPRNIQEDDADTEDEEEDADEAGEGDVSPDTQAVSLEPGCKFVVKGYVVTVLLIALGMALVATYQAFYPGH